MYLRDQTDLDHLNGYYEPPEYDERDYDYDERDYDYDERDYGEDEELEPPEGYVCDKCGEELDLGWTWTTVQYREYYGAQEQSESIYYCSSCSLQF